MEDTLKATRYAIGMFIKDNAPEGMRFYDKVELETLLTSDNWYPSNIEFRRNFKDGEICGVTLTVGDMMRWKDDFIEDNDGNTWKKIQYHFSVNWSSFSEMSCEAAGVYIALMTEIYTFAQKLNDIFTEPCFTMVQTKEERTAAEDSQKRRRTRDLIQQAFEKDGLDAIKGMRVGTPSRLFRTTLPATIFVGSHAVEYHGKAYDIKNSIVDLDGMFLCEVVRTK